MTDSMVDAQVVKGFEKLPVTVLSGFLGSGKTTLLRHLLQNNQGMRIAMIVNDMASINIDADRARLVQREAKMVQMQNGCICCTLREDLLLEIKKLALENKFDYLLIESTGVSEPLPVAETFTFGQLEEHTHDHDHEHDHDEEHVEPQGGDEEQPNAMEVLSDIAKLDCMVTVMDAKQFFDHLDDEQDIFEKWGGEEEIAEEDQGRSVATLMIDQIEFANVILLNKTDLVSADELNVVRSTVKKLNPSAKILTTHYSKVEPKEVINTGLFHFEEAQYYAGWLKELRGTHTAESDEYGISSFIYRSRKPMSSNRFSTMFYDGKFQDCNVIRAKGSLWLDCCDELIVAFDIAGASGEVHAQTPWFVEMVKNDPDMWKSLPVPFRLAVLEDFEGPQGDKRQEMVFIGKDMNEEKIRELVDSCLLTDEEMAKDWASADNPFEVIMGGNVKEEIEENAI